MGALLFLLVAAATVAAMEAVAWAVHKYVMHGPGWAWHRSHHRPRQGTFEKNDLYAMVFAGLSLLLFMLADAWWPLRAIAVGTAVYGLLYTLFHDGLVHRRLPFFRAPRRGYLKRLVQAHRIHHAVAEREGAVSFGFLYAPSPRKLKRELSGKRAAR
jgi:beta-carotene 3-hydroxylase